MFAIIVLTTVANLFVTFVSAALSVTQHYQTRHWKVSLLHDKFTAHHKDYL